MKKLLTSCFLFAGIWAASGQTKSITLDSCYLLAKQNYPQVKRYALIARTGDLSLQNLAKGYLPRIAVNGQATYQSDVTSIPIKIPGTVIPQPDNDQYKVYAEVNETLYDGGVIRQQKKLTAAQTALEQQRLSVQLYALKDRVNQLYFGILLIDAELKLNRLMENDIRAGMAQATAAVAGGTALKSSVDVLTAALLTAGQRTIELAADRGAYIAMMRLFINRPLDDSTVFIKPPPVHPPEEILRPELGVFKYQNEMIDAQNGLLKAVNSPKVSVFGQAGYGKPAFNIFSDRFDPFYIAGVRLSFPLTGFYTLKNKRALLGTHRQGIALQRETFLFNTRITLQQQDAEMTKLQKIIRSDEQIVQLRTRIMETALAQLKNGVLHTRDYVREVNAADDARQERILHEVRLLKAEYDKQTTTGTATETTTDDSQNLIKDN
jgi:outer membrane protein TolC